MEREEQRERELRLKWDLEKTVANTVAADDPDAFETRPPWPGAEPSWGQERAPLALPGLAVTRRMMLAARALEREAIAHARGQGHTWTQIGRQFGKPFETAAQRAGMSLAVATWRYAAFGKLPDEDVSWSVSTWEDEVTWRCWDCAATVRESHPDDGPDTQKGHRPGCPRIQRKDI